MWGLGRLAPGKRLGGEYRGSRGPQQRHRPDLIYSLGDSDNGGRLSWTDSFKMSCRATRRRVPGESDYRMGSNASFLAGTTMISAPPASYGPAGWVLVAASAGPASLVSHSTIRARRAASGPSFVFGQITIRQRPRLRSSCPGGKQLSVGYSRLCRSSGGTDLPAAFR